MLPNLWCRHHRQQDAALGMTPCPFSSLGVRLIQRKNGTRRNRADFRLFRILKGCRHFSRIGRWP
jgi:hypothetical protein